MARPVLPTDFKDDILAESMSGKRRYRIIQNADGTVSLDDVTDYEQVGSTFGAKQVNDISSAVNSIEDVKAANNCTTTEPGFVLDARQGKTLMDKSNELSRDFAGGQMEIRLTEAGKGEYRKKGADTWTPFRSEIRIINIFLPPHRDNWGHMDIDVSEYSTLFIGSVTTSGNHAAEIIGDDVLIGSYKHGDKNITVDISGIRQLRFRNGLKATDWSRYADFGNIIIS